MKIVILTVALATLLQLTAVTQASKQEDNFQATEWQKLPFEDFKEETSVIGTRNEKEYVIRIQMLSLDLDMKLVFPSKKGSKDLSGSIFRNDPPNLGKILKCKDLPEYPGNTTCSEHHVFKRKEPGLISQVKTMMKNMWSFMVTTLVKGWKTCSNGVGTTVKNIWNGRKWMKDLAGKIWTRLLDWVCGVKNGLMYRVGKVWNGLKGLAEWVFIRMMWVDEYVYHGSLWAAEWYWDHTEWLTELTWNGMEWIWDHIEWLARFLKENPLWLAEKTWIGLKRWAEWTWGEAKRFADLSWNVIKKKCKPLEPALEYVLEMVQIIINFYNEYVHEHLLKIQVKIIVSSWRETGYTISAVLVMNCVMVAVYKLISSPVKLFRRRWQAYKDWKKAEEASWRLPPRRQSRSNKRVWENPKKKKLYRNEN
ncbi:uncharacterized protein LOC111327384 [Stylophora pistillata]|uniref:Uncharacterized protein n=1 Tax=Stylophora pistillata TaxID=50429 RepID=A0A2B4SGH7_STYPI|nr:uncharacterized protein LOC111327384 [Stylophora pistillata]PFX27555.1 hypothetical protein AWC38_SpisGene7691 [Stylophora pistillata]